MRTITVDLTELPFLVKRGMPKGSDIVVLPELADGGYAALKRGAGTHRIGDPYFGILKAISKSSRALLIPGSARVHNDDGSYTNSAFVFRRGNDQLRYDKINLFLPTQEHRLFTAGKRLGTCRFKSSRGQVTLGLMICFDLRFPEISRELFRQKADLIIVPARWPNVRREAWKTLLKARAIENQVFMVGCNAKGKEGGASFIFDPMGREVRPVRHPEGAGWKRYHLDLAVREEARRFYDAGTAARRLPVSFLR
jgi:predicted amidohydrolase